VHGDLPDLLAQLVLVVAEKRSQVSQRVTSLQKFLRWIDSTKTWPVSP